MSTAGDVARWEREVAWTTRLRWVGVALFAVALLLAALHVVLITRGMAWPRAIPCILALGLSLSAFGTADDTALHGMRQLASPGPVPPRHAAEYDQERLRRPARVEAVHASPRAVWLIPLAAVVVIGLLSWRAWGIWPGLSPQVYP